MSDQPRTTQNPLRIVFFGNERIATGITTNNPIFKKLLNDGHQIVTVVVNNDEQPGTHKTRTLEIANVAAEQGIPLIAPRKLTDISEQLRSYNADVAILVAYGKIVPQSVIDMFPHGIINIHPSLLPKHRGPTPIESAILGGESETGVSLMQLAQEMDAGPVFAQSKLSLTGDEQKQVIADQLLEIAAAMLSSLLQDIIDGTVIAVPQKHSDATYDTRLTKEDGRIDWNKPAEQLSREIRAFAEWPKSRVVLGGIEAIITAARHQKSLDTLPDVGRIEISDTKDTLRVSCRDGYLCIDRLKPAGKKEMTIAEFIRGYASRLENPAN